MLLAITGCGLMAAPVVVMALAAPDGLDPQTGAVLLAMLVLGAALLLIGCFYDSASGRMDVWGLAVVFGDRPPDPKPRRQQVRTPSAPGPASPRRRRLSRLLRR